MVFLTTDLSTNKITSIKRIKGEFPNYKPIFPNKPPIIEIMLDSKMLAELLQIAAKLDFKCKMKIYGKESPIVLEAKNDNQSARMMLMPISQ